MSIRDSSSTAQPTVEEWYAYTELRILKTSDDLGWSSLHANYSQLQPGREFYPNPGVTDYFLITVLDGKSRMKQRVGSRLTHDMLITPGSTQLITQDHEGSSLWDAPHRLLFLRLPRTLLTTLADGTVRGDPARAQLILRVNFYDPLLWGLVTALHGELHQANPLGTLYAESLANTLMLHLLHRYSNVGAAPRLSPARLIAGQMRVIEEYVQAHLGEKITLEALAGCIHMSVPHFERVFRRTMGCAPYQYVLERRLERAKWLLEVSDVAVYEVGRRCGFANQSHFTRHFSKRYGVSPARFRYERGAFGEG